MGDFAWEEARMAEARGQRKTFVLVHGAWRGGWLWRPVADRLAARGHKVYAPTLTGVADRSHLLRPEIDLGTHITDIVNLMTWEDLDNIVLCGHSYSGMVISGAAEAMERAISSIVYVDAFMPENGQALIDLLSPARREVTLALVARGALTQEPIPAAAFGVREDMRAYVDKKCTPHPIGCFTQKLTLTGARERIRKKTYILATGWETHFRAYYEQKKADPTWRTHEVPGSHDVMLEMPEPIAAILEMAA
jgi:pimeloyl-ACP methyl ester carboxylesterase